MKKTVSINIKGINFLFEEDAYSFVQDYLNSLKTSLHNQEGSDEILEDVELRIAELCAEKMQGSKEVIELADIQEICQKIGNPADFIDSDEAQDSGYQSTSNNKQQDKSEKRLFRDTDEAQLAGVCAGLSNFFGIDVIIIRLLWILFVFAGFGILMYIILWIVVPQANSNIDRLRMQGKPINLENISQEVENAADRLNKASKKFSNKITQSTDGLHRGINLVARIIMVCIGLFSIGLGLVFLVSFIIFIVAGGQIIPADTTTGYLSISQIGELLLPAAHHVGYAWLTGLTFTLSVITLLFVFGAITLFKIKNRWTKYLVGGLVSFAFISGFGGIILGIISARDVSIDAKLEQEIASTDVATLYIEPIKNKSTNGQGFTVVSDRDFGILSIDDDRIIGSEIKIEYRNSSDSLYHIYRRFSANAHTHDKAEERASHIQHRAELLGDTLMISPLFSYPKADKIRFQNTRIIVEIPRGKRVKFGEQYIELGNTHKEDEEMEVQIRETGKLYPDGTYTHRK